MKIEAWFKICWLINWRAIEYWTTYKSFMNDSFRTTHQKDDRAFDASVTLKTPLPFLLTKKNWRCESIYQKESDAK